MSALIEIRNLTVAYDGIPTVTDASLDLNYGEVLAIVGESGSGKSTLARALLGIAPVQDGRITFDGQPLPVHARDRSSATRRRFGMVFQDSGSAFNPRFTIGKILEEPLVLAGMSRRSVRRKIIFSLLNDVGLGPDYLTRYPNELSGGQRQRVGIVRALACDPDVLICDEAVSALDVSVQAQILNLLVDIQDRRKLALVFITHDLSVVEYLADRIAVMKQGRIVEQNLADVFLDGPEHPYSQALLAAQSPFKLDPPANAQSFNHAMM
ncbi:ABC transporter ATP-binding protein [Afipia sp. DC4300-2b1]|uniref:ABC transporter ATP-binding protein n=1 Tax=Afipia sp. DC4300-2b1 TaxID=2804672 RepID=UPI003CEFD469